MDDHQKRRALESIPYAVYVVGVKQGDVLGAYTANWICQASFRPPLLMLGVKADGRQRACMESDPVLTVNLLDESQRSVAAAFVRWNEPRDGRLGGIGFTTGVTGTPILDDAPAYLECRVRRIVPGGDHDVAIAEVVEAVVRRDFSPLHLSQTGWSYGG